MTPEQIAHVAYEANRALQCEHADPTLPVSVPWEDLADEAKASRAKGVIGVQSGNTPQQTHENWASTYRVAGWTYGPFKDEAAKTHPLLVPYSQVPESQKVKDHLFVGIVRTLSREIA